MARTITQIQTEIIAEKERTSGLDALSSTSKTTIWRLWTHVVAVAIWTLETLFDFHKKEVDQLLLTKKPHNLLWYKKKAEDFQFGKALKADGDQYDNTGLDPIEVGKSRIVKHVAAVEIKGLVRVKAAKEVNGELQKLSRKDPDELGALNRYMQQIKDAGVKLIVDSLDPDRLKLSMIIYYDAMVLDAQGGRLDGASIKPVNDTIKTYLRNLPFNGEFVLATLTDRLQETPGVIIPQITHVAATYGNLEDRDIPVRYVPDAGYLRIYDEAKDLKITYKPYNHAINENQEYLENLEICSH